MTDYETVIGLEVHVELNTKSKMFCACSADYFGKKPNTHTCPVCLGLPGAIPFINKEAIDKCRQIGLALGCKVVEKSLFERKNYFYPDLAKGYQISQLRWPLCIEGSIEVLGRDGKISKIRINRAHQEEDTGKLTHINQTSLIDFNRSGVPLVEIVTEPDFTDSDQIRDYAKQLQNIFQTLGVSNADMEKGDMRLEANISVRPVGQKELPPYRVELKNINSFRFMVAAVEFEIKRQIEALEAGEKLTQETRGWNETKKETYLQRSKEEANDYRYFPEPDLSYLLNTQEEIAAIKSKLPELPKDKEEKFIHIGISPTSAKTITTSRIRVLIFELASKSVDTNDLAAFGNFFANRTLESTDKEMVEDYAKTEVEAFAKYKNAKSAQISNTEDLAKIITQVISQNEKSVQDYKSGNENAIQALIGAAMRISGGKANAQKVIELLKQQLK